MTEQIKKDVKYLHENICIKKELTNTDLYTIKHICKRIYTECEKITSEHFNLSKLSVKLNELIPLNEIIVINMAGDNNTFHLRIYTKHDEELQFYDTGKVIGTHKPCKFLIDQLSRDVSIIYNWDNNSKRGYWKL